MLKRLKVEGKTKRKSMVLDKELPVDQTLNHCKFLQLLVVTFSLVPAVIVCDKFIEVYVAVMLLAVEF